MAETTLQSYSLLILRIMIGIVFLAHGSQKLFGWFGGYGITGTYNYLNTTLGVPAIIAAAGVVAEFTAGALLITGTLTGLGSILVILQMSAAIYLLDGHNGFFMNYFGQYEAGKEGFEYAAFLIGTAVLLLINGPGKYSVDAMMNIDFVRRSLGLG
ncbi:MAG: DoxX family protein [Ignavibacteriales bacterium]|nr:DoxX family protein [Ignavibacteriales bacterium]